MTRPINPVVHEIVEKHVAEHGVELVEFNHRTGKTTTLAVLIHKPGGVSVEDCKSVSRAIERDLEEREAIQGPWRLDVASPGLDRPLKNEADFRRAIWENVHVELTERHQDRGSYDGLVLSSGQGELRLSVKGGEILVPISKVRWGKILVSLS